MVFWGSLEPAVTKDIKIGSRSARSQQKSRHCTGKIRSNVNSPEWNHQAVKMRVEVKKR